MKCVAIAVLVLVGSVSSVAAAPVLWSSAAGGNDHFYEYVGTPMTWDAARAAAAGTTHAGMPGYLATITSAAEQNFILTSVTRSTSWIGGTDRTAEGVWRWETGPEAGDIFFGPGASAGAFAFWNSGEPNDCCAGEDEAVFAWGAGGAWNDIGTPSFPNYAVGFIAEFSRDEDGGSDVVEPSSLLLLAAGLAGAARRYLRS